MTILTWMHLIIHEYLIDFSMVSIILHGFQGACSAQQNFLPSFLSFPPTSCYCFYTVFFLDPEKIVFNPSPVEDLVQIEPELQGFEGQTQVQRSAESIGSLESGAEDWKRLIPRGQGQSILNCDINRR